MIDNVIQEIVKVTALSLQNSNLWELYVVGDDPNNKYRVQSVSLPFLGFETETRKTGTKHYTYYVPEDEFSITFLETTNFDTFNFLNNWKNLIYDSRRRVFRANGLQHTKNFQLIFQKDTVMRFIGPLNTYYRHGTQGFLFQRVLFKNIATLDLDYVSTDPLTITATFVCDSITPIAVGSLIGGNLQSRDLTPKFADKLRKNNR